MLQGNAWAWLVLLSAVITAAGCSARKQAAAPGNEGIVVTSGAFAHGDPIPAKYTGDGQDLSPPLSWSGVPAEAKSIVIICDDPDAPGGTFVHWLLYDLPPTEREIKEGVPRDEKLPNGACQGTNDFGRFGYIGPSPPSGPAHHYHFRVYALSKPTGLKPGASRGDLEGAMRGNVLASGELVGTYRR